MFDLIKKTMLTGVGLAAMTKDKVEELAKELSKKGKLSEKEGKDLDLGFCFSFEKHLVACADYEGVGVVSG